MSRCNECGNNAFSAGGLTAELDIKLITTGDTRVPNE
jgi:hypothetical protein